jgi:hypothetical protein
VKFEGGLLAKETRYLEFETLFKPFTFLGFLERVFSYQAGISGFHFREGSGEEA